MPHRTASRKVSPNSLVDDDAVDGLRKPRDIMITDEFRSDVMRAVKQRGMRSFSQFVNESLEFYLKAALTPLIGVVQAGEPDSCELVEQRHVYCSELPGGDRYAYVEVHGYSMSNRIPHGALALIKRRTPYHSGSVVAVCVGPLVESCLKVVRILPCGTISLVSDACESLADPDTFAPIYLCAPEQSQKIKDAPPDAIFVDPDNVTIEGVWTGSYIYCSQES